MCSIIIIIYIHIISAKSHGLAAWLWLFNSQARPKAVAGCDFGPARPSLFWLGLARLLASGWAKHSTSCNTNFGEASINCAYLPVCQAIWFGLRHSHGQFSVDPLRPSLVPDMTPEPISQMHIRISILRVFWVCTRSLKPL
jgi:hypothetical protein